MSNRASSESLRRVKEDHDRGEGFSEQFLPYLIFMTLPCSLLLPSAGGYLDDLYSFDPVTMTWMLLSIEAGRPVARNCHGFTSAGGKLYVHGGFGFGGMSIFVSQRCCKPSTVTSLFLAPSAPHIAA